MLGRRPCTWGATIWESPQDSRARLLTYLSEGYGGYCMNDQACRAGGFMFPSNISPLGRGWNHRPNTHQTVCVSFPKSLWWAGACPYLDAFAAQDLDSVHPQAPERLLRGWGWRGGLAHAVSWGLSQVLPSNPLRELPPVLLSLRLRHPELFCTSCWRSGGSLAQHKLSFSFSFCFKTLRFSQSRLVLGDD